LVAVIHYSEAEFAKQAPLNSIYHNLTHNMMTQSQANVKRFLKGGCKSFDSAQDKSKRPDRFSEANRNL